MATVTELINQDVKRMRLPFWNDFAWLEPRPTGPWADLHDIDAVVPVLIVECDRDDRWVSCDVHR